MNVEITSLETRPDEYCACFCVSWPSGEEYRVGGQIPLDAGKGKTPEQITALCWAKALPLVTAYEARFVNAPAPAKAVEVSLDALPEKTNLGGGVLGTKSPEILEAVGL